MLTQRRRLGIERLEDRSLLSLTALFDAALGDLSITGSDGDHTLHVDVTGRGEIQLATSDGRESVPVLDAATREPCGSRAAPCPTAANTAAIRAALAGGDDVVEIQWAHRAGDLLGLIEVDLGAGKDTVHAHYEQIASAAPSPLRGQASLKLDGGAGHDAINAVLVSPPDDGMPWSGRMDLSLLGGDGKDAMDLLMGISPGAGFEFVGVLDGGAGHDAINAVLTSPPDDNMPWSGRMDLSLLGGTGKDRLTMFLPNPPDDGFEFVGLIDGGAGVDFALASPGVLVQNVEEGPSR